MTITTERLQQLFEDLHEQYQREEDQAILQRDMHKAELALAGKEALTRIKNNLGLRLEMDANIAPVTSVRKRA